MTPSHSQKSIYSTILETVTENGFAVNCLSYGFRVFRLSFMTFPGFHWLCYVLCFIVNDFIVAITPSSSETKTWHKNNKVAFTLHSISDLLSHFEGKFAREWFLHIGVCIVNRFMARFLGNISYREGENINLPREVFRTIILLYNLIFTHHRKSLLRILGPTHP